MAAIFSFAFAFLAIIGMLIIKNWEVKAGKTLSHEFRFKADRAVAKWTTILKSHLPTRGRVISKELSHNIAYHVSHVALAGVHFAERKLIRVINFIKGKGIVNKDRATSHYLKNVSEYERHPERKNKK
ncbi:MAG: hypothetical protein QGH85_01460 [Candidatus Pacebacteria bacterium]|jgi:hypothetical protein|nr:hypothetical protein [Parcubacteria group bacterium]MDP6249631.1 hypothetical protein [Candidatus Paceibacterota bacterium]MDP7159379.1 hypothetical protein [Candidatus Paceibacterota bacterium]MDP7366193.1 hypothetical protein [Candidatus Paceibacterota bacterium]MDP7466270.1 hypothetical protein [Candidatus Paceibacterota bacterium]|tara:strand:- start:5928 stop:6311 length:384 start_codon:yes stop_codon:yes gene_type:complete